jgi:hypothetical protein
MTRARLLQNARALAPTVFSRDDSRSHGEAGATNVLVHGENLDVMSRLAVAGFAGRFRCIYLDPPFNSGRRFAEYEDSLGPEAWRRMVRDRLEAARVLLADDGAVFVEIDDTELGPLQVEMDDVFGRDQRVSTITVVRSAATGHKAAIARAGAATPSSASVPATIPPTQRGWRTRRTLARRGASCPSRPTPGASWGAARGGRTSSATRSSTRTTWCASPSPGTKR